MTPREKIKALAGEFEATWKHHEPQPTVSSRGWTPRVVMSFGRRLGEVVNAVGRIEATILNVSTLVDKADRILLDASTLADEADRILTAIELDGIDIPTGRLAEAIRHLREDLPPPKIVGIPKPGDRKPKCQPWSRF